MNRETTQSDWQKIACYLGSHDYVSIVKGLVSYFTEV